MSGWHTLAHHAAEPLPPDWRDRLAARLGQRPRRIGPWAELALYGARCCLDAAHEPVLPAGVQLRVASLSGPRTAVLSAIEQGRCSLPQPFTFMQSQPSQMLAALSQHLGWQGDARFTVSRDVRAWWQLACCEAGPAGLLVGWVEEGDEPRSEWWRLVRTA